MKKERSKHFKLCLFMGIMGLILITRLFFLTVAEHDKWKAYADDMNQRAVYETAPRGDITDRNGKVLAASRAVYSVNISRAAVDEEQALESAACTADILMRNGENISVTQADLKRQLGDKGYYGYLPVVLAENISQETASQIEAAALPGINIAENYVREYPYGALASHIIGYMGRISADELENYKGNMPYRTDAMIGKSGIEKVCEEQLRGTDGVSALQVDSQGNVIKLLENHKSAKGSDVQLTLDADLQQTAEDALEQAIKQAACGGVFQMSAGLDGNPYDVDENPSMSYQMSYAGNAASGAAVALDIKTGEVLAMASYPDFDPNDFAEGISSEKWAQLQKTNENDPLSPSPLYNIATMTAVQPGSTFKPVTALAALSCGLDRDQSLYDNGEVQAGGRSYGFHIWNSSEGTHGYVDLKQAMKVSCNYYFYDIAAGTDLASGEPLDYTSSISNEKIVRFAKQLGLGEKTGIEIPETAGTRPSEDLKESGLKAYLADYLLEEGETYFTKSALKDREEIRKNIQKIINWSDKDLTLEEMTGKLKQEDFVRENKAQELAALYIQSCFSQMEWTLGDTFNISIGQGDNAYTVLQMADYMAVLGNRGVRNQVRLLAGSSGRSSRLSQINQNDIEYVIEAMTGVTQEEDGSLYRVFEGFPYEVAAKTGTAQRAGKINVEDETEYLRQHLHLIAPDVSFAETEEEAARLMAEYPDLYSTEAGALRRAVINLSRSRITSEDLDRYKESYDNFAWTVALAPADDPQIAVAVMIVQGKTASNAAPVVREIIGKYGEIMQWEK